MFDRRHYRLAWPTDSIRGAVLIIGGSEGGHHPADAAALAQSGFLALSLAYFGLPGLPRGLVDIPIERFVRGVDALVEAAGSEVPVGVLGGSRGGEAALLLAAVDHRVKAVVSVVGSGVVTAGIDYTAGSLANILRRRVDAWTVDGRPAGPALPHLDADRLGLVLAANPVRLRNTYTPLTEVDVDAVTIPVERSDAAILAVSAAQDAMWDSVGLSQVSFDRLARHSHPRPSEHVVLEAGHTIAGPPGPTQVPGPGVTFEVGGTPEANATARREAWRLSLDWFDSQLS